MTNPSQSVPVVLLEQQGGSANNSATTVLCNWESRIQLLHVHIYTEIRNVFARQYVYMNILYKLPHL